jgi:hypothetical protein
MGGHLATPADWITTGRKYKTRPERGVKKISGASPLPREGPEARGGSEGGASPLSESRTQVLQAFGISRGHCAMKLADGLGEEGRAELAHDRAAPVMAYGMAEKDSGLVRAIVAANGCVYVLDMRDIASVGILDPDGRRCAMPECEPWGRARKNIPHFRLETEKSKKPEICPKRRGPRWDLNPRGYEQEIGPGHQRTGRHEPSSCACVIGLGGINVISTCEYFGR